MVLMRRLKWETLVMRWPFLPPRRQLIFPYMFHVLLRIASAMLLQLMWLMHKLFPNAKFEGMPGRKWLL